MTQDAAAVTKRVERVDVTAPVTPAHATVEVNGQPIPVLFLVQRSNKFALEDDAIGLPYQAAVMAFTNFLAYTAGLKADFSKLPVPAVPPLGDGGSHPDRPAA
jgi:hypothetical protein